MTWIYSAKHGRHGSQKAEVSGHLGCLTTSAGPLQLSSSDGTICEKVWVLSGPVLDGVSHAQESEPDARLCEPKKELIRKLVGILPDVYMAS